MPSHTPQEFRRLAAIARRQATITADPKLQDQLFEIAIRYEVAADHAETPLPPGLN